MKKKLPIKTASKRKGGEINRNSGSLTVQATLPLSPRSIEYLLKTRSYCCFKRIADNKTTLLAPIAVKILFSRFFYERKD